MWKFIFLGAIQGLTEFFPVSSSGHLVLAQRFMGITQDTIFLDIWLHLGTLLAVFTFFHKDIRACLKDRRLLMSVLIATSTTWAIAFSLKGFFKSLFLSEAAVGICLILTSLVLFSTRLLREGKKDLGLADAAFMGLAQGFAVAPGLSRSGLTVAALLSRGLTREKAFRFSFVASIPAIIGAFLLEAKGASLTVSFSAFELGAGLLSAYATGLLTLQALKKIVMNGKLYLFGFYCAGIGALVLTVTRLSLH
jgi:undecaprenyl-diphosphatase